jgi:hypothetical protein
MNDSPDKLKQEISTPADAIALLNKKFSSLWMSYHTWQGEGSNGEDVLSSNVAILRSGQDVLTSTVAGRSDMVTAVAYLLSDYYNIGGIYGFWHASDGTMNPVKAVNYIYSLVFN